MTQIAQSVGERGKNDTPDVAIVQVLLRVTRNTHHKPYLGHHFINGRYDGVTKKAITDFQRDFGLAVLTATSAGAAAWGVQLAQTLGKAIGGIAAITMPTDTLGLVEVNSSTLKALVREATKVNADYGNIRALPGSRMVYVAGTTQELEASIQSIRDAKRMGRHSPVGNPGEGLESGFREVVIRLIRRVFNQHGIVLGPWGKFSFGRDFDGQLSRVETGSSQAQPGEGNHNFGRAMDVGYKGLKWIADDGSIHVVKNENDFDAHLAWRRDVLYRARNQIMEKPPRGTGELYRIRMKSGDNDPNHFQAVNQIPDWYPGDKLVSMAQSLAGLLTKVGPKFSLTELQNLGLAVTGSMQWSPGHGVHQYACDLGFGGAMFGVGSATEIFQGHARVTTAMLAQATNAAAGAGQPHVKASAFTHRQVDAMKRALKAIFQLADDNWRDWQALDKLGNAI